MPHKSRVDTQEFGIVWASSTNLHDLSHDLFIGSFFKVIADLQDWNRSLGMLVPGPSGQPISPCYVDNIQDWLQGEYHPLLFVRESVLKEIDITLIIISA